MNVTCLDTQKKLFETRILNRMAEPVFVSSEQLNRALQSPLLLFGEWRSEWGRDGLRWLSSFAYNLPFPCIVCSPFELGEIDEYLGLQVSLKVTVINTNSLILPERGLLASPKGRVLRVQADFGFLGPAGTPLVIDQENRTAVALALQPKNTDTPLILCGARLFSASGLSDERDRLTLFEALVTWAATKHTQSLPSEATESTTPALDAETFKSLCVLLAGTSASSTQELVTLADSVLGLDLLPEEIDIGLSFMSENGLIDLVGNSISIHTELLEQYVRQTGLWPYVRILRRDYARQER